MEYEWKHVIILNNMVTVSLIGKVIFGERLDRSKGGNQANFWGKHVARQRWQLVYRTWGSRVAAVFQGEQWGQCVLVQFSSVAQSYPTLCNPMHCSTPGFSVYHQLLEPTHSNSYPSCQWCHPNTSSPVIPFFSCLQSFPASGSFPVSQFFTLGGQSIGISASASFLPMNIQDWFLFL